MKGLTHMGENMSKEPRKRGARVWVTRECASERDILRREKETSSRFILYLLFCIVHCLVAKKLVSSAFLSILDALALLCPCIPLLA